MTGRKTLLIASLVLCAIAGTSGLYASSLSQILLGRVVLGVAVAGIMTSSTALIGDYFTGSSRSFIIGLQGAFLGLGGVIQLYAGGHLAEMGWRYPFALYGVSLLFVPAAILFLFEPDRSSYADVFHESGASLTVHPILFVVILCGTAMVSQIAFYTIPVELPFFLAGLGLVNPTAAGNAMAILILCASGTALLYRRLITIASYTVIVSLTLAVMAAGFFILAGATKFSGVIAAMIVLGIGLGLLYPNLTTWIMARTAPHIRGRIIGALTLSFFLGQFLSPVVSETLTRMMTMAEAYFMLGIALILGAVPFGIYGVVQSRRAESHLHGRGGRP